MSLEPLPATEAAPVDLMGVDSDADFRGLTGPVVEPPVAEVAADGPELEVEDVLGEDVESVEPVVSAKATAAEADAITAPAPSAIASAPTRPMQRA